MAQSQQLLVIDANSFAPVQTDVISRVPIDKIGVDPSQRSCARIKMHINRMTREDIAGISVRPVGGSVVVTKQIVATEGNGLIVEMTAKAPTRFYLHHDKYGDSKEVSLNLEGNKEYKLEAMLNTTHSIVVNSNTIGAEVYVDNIFKGNITSNYNLTISDIYPGKHKIKVKMGGLESENEVDVNPLNIQFRINLESVKAQFVVFSVSPKNASVIIDGKDEVPDNDGFVVLTKNNGTYSYTISAKDYHEERGQFTVSGSKVEKSVSLRPAFGWLRVSGQGVLQGASVYVDGELIGKAPVTSDKISSGEHSVRIVKNLYKTSVERIVIEDNKYLDYAPELVADFARVTINAGEGSNIYINDKHKGESPWSGDLASGTYVFEARKNGHRTTSISKTIEATPSKQSYNIPAPTPILGTVIVKSSPVMADIHIDGKTVGKTPLEQELIIGSHKVTVSKDGYQSQEKAITISEGKTEEVNLTLTPNQTTQPTVAIKISDSDLARFRKQTSVVIPEGVTEIQANAFKNCKSLTSITIPSSVTKIGKDAFYWCSSLKSVHISDLSAWCKIDFASYSSNPLDFAKHLYLNDELVTSLTIPTNITEIKQFAFHNCESLTSVTIPDSVTKVGKNAFKYCTSLTSVTIGNSVTSIGEFAFYWCTSLTSVTIGNSVTSIGKDAFYYCQKLTSVYISDLSAWCKIDFANYYSNPLCLCGKAEHLYLNDELVTSLTIPTNITQIKQFAFSDYDSLTNITIPDSVTSIGDSAFWSCESLTSVTIGNSVTSIGDSAFWHCESLTSVTIGNSVTSIGKRAFTWCPSLTSITIPNSVTSIGEDAFYDCDSLTSVTIPNSVTDIGGAAFASCNSLKAFYGKFASSDNRYLIVDGVLNSFATGCGATEYTIPNSVTSIGDSAFASCKSLTSITIPNSVTKIGEGAFSYCSKLTSVTIPNSVTKIEKDAFEYCTSLTSVTIPDSVTSIGYAAFSYCSKLTSVTIPNSVTSIGEFAFHNCESLTSVTIPNSVTSIGRDAFEGCTSLTSVTIPDSVTKAGQSAFEGCTSLTSVYCKPTTPPTVDFEMFKDNAPGRKIYVPRNSVAAYKSAAYWKGYADYIVGYDF